MDDSIEPPFRWNERYERVWVCPICHEELAVDSIYQFSMPVLGADGHVRVADMRQWVDPDRSLTDLAWLDALSARTKAMWEEMFEGRDVPGLVHKCVFRPSVNSAS